MYFEMMALLRPIYCCKENKASFFLEPLRGALQMMKSTNSLLWNSAPTWLPGEVLVFNLASCFIYLMIIAYHYIKRRLSIFSQYSTCSILLWAQILMGAGVIPLLQMKIPFPAFLLPFHAVPSGVMCELTEYASSLIYCPSPASCIIIPQPSCPNPLL